MGSSRQEYWRGLPWPPPEDLPNPGVEPPSLMSPALTGEFFATSTTWEAPQIGMRGPKNWDPLIKKEGEMITRWKLAVSATFVELRFICDPLRKVPGKSVVSTWDSSPSVSTTVLGGGGQHSLLSSQVPALSWEKWKWKSQSPTLCDLMDYTVHGILQARILAWVAFPFSRGSSQPKDQTQISQIAGGFFTSWATTEARSELYIYQSPTILNVVIET